MDSDVHPPVCIHSPLLCRLHTTMLAVMHQYAAGNRNVPMDMSRKKHNEKYLWDNKLWEKFVKLFQAV